MIYSACMVACACTHTWRGRGSGEGKEQENNFNELFFRRVKKRKEILKNEGLVIKTIIVVLLDKNCIELIRSYSTFTIFYQNVQTIDELVIKGNEITLTSISTLGCNFFMRSTILRMLDLDFSLVEIMY